VHPEITPSEESPEDGSCRRFAAIVRSDEDSLSVFYVNATLSSRRKFRIVMSVNFIIMKILV
jgi:hypothetical protein